MDAFLQDVRYALRMLVKSPGFTLIALVTLALGIGVNTIIFSAVNAILLRPLPYQEPGRIVYLWTSEPARGLDKMTVSIGDYADYRQQADMFDQVAAHYDGDFNVLIGGEPDTYPGSRLSPSFLPLLGAKPLHGRVFLPEEEQAGKHRVVILSHKLWQQKFNSDPGVVGQPLTINRATFSIVGVMPPNFNFPDEKTQLWVPLSISGGGDDRATRFLTVVARLKPGVTVETAQQACKAIAQQIAQQHVENRGITVTIEPLEDHIFGNIRPGLQVFQGAVLFVLLIVCANIASLLLARSAVRQREVAVRLAMGARRGRLIRQFLTESLVLALLGGAAGIALAYWGIPLLVALAPDSIPRTQEIVIDGRVLGFSLGLSLLTSFIFGLVPAIQSSKANVNDMLKSGGRTLVGTIRGRHLLKTIVVTEIALALVLLVGAGLLVNSFLRMRSVDLGFTPDDLLTMQINLPASRYREDEQMLSFYQQLLQRVSTLPTVQAAGITQSLPMGAGEEYFLDMEAEGQPQGQDEMPPVGFFQVSPDYFHAIGTRLIRGRFFTEQDGKDTPLVAVIAEGTARLYFGAQDPIGRKIRIGNPQDWSPWITVVGVAADIRYRDVTTTPWLQVYTPYSQATRIGASRKMLLAVRTSSNPLNLVTAIRQQVWQIDSDQPIAHVNTMEELVSDMLGKPRFNMVLLTVFSAIALILAAIGIAGVLSYMVAQRRREIGIRMAMGAQPFDVLRMVIGEGMILAVAGVVIGIAFAIGLTRLMASLLFGVTSTDLTTFAVITLVLIIVALLACYFPARKAASIEPLIALRYE